jgi:ketosteroid isomerase-like protein
MLRCIAFAVIALASASSFAQHSPPPMATVDDASAVLEAERQWAAAIQRRDAPAMSQFLADGYFLAIAVQGQPLAIVPRESWLRTLEVYVTHSVSLDDHHVHVYGDTAVVIMLYTQQATVAGKDRSGQFLITDIWVRTPAGWRVAERHSSRPEPAAAARP